MPLGFPVVPEVYRMNSGCSAWNASGVCSSDWPSTSSSHHTSLSPQVDVDPGAADHQDMLDRGVGRVDRFIDGVLERRRRCRAGTGRRR